MDENVRRKLVEIDEELGRVPLPRGLEARVLEGRAPAGAASGWIVLAGAGAAAVLAFALGRQTAPRPESAAVAVAVEAGGEPVAAVPSDPHPHAATHEASREACPTSLVTEAVTLLPLGCSVALSSPGMAIAAHTPVRIARTKRGVRVLEGDAFFAVEKVEPGAQTVQVEVDGGTIEVLGTRFVVHQARAEGHVDLLEGAIEFTAGDGTRRAVDPGRRLHWADGAIVDDGATEPDTHVEHAGPRIAPAGERNAAAEPEVALDAVLDQVATLRRRGDYREAATLLRDTRASIRDAAASEILSYEEGTLREHDQAQEAACAFWRGHMRRFGESGRYATAVTGRLSRLGCTER